MPNWCENELVIRGIKEDLDKFKKDMGEKLLDEEKLIPYPKKFREQDEVAREWEAKASEYAKKVGKEGAKNWYCGDKLTKKQRDGFIKEFGERPKDGFSSSGYNWCIKNWDTKWGFCDVLKEYETKEKICYSFLTAWSPPLKLIETMAEKYPKLEIRLTYVERGVGFSGYAVYENGILIASSE
ncbi:MAG: hypothetical protein H8D45_26500 [Bacteroidetes bacterium]|nr:hypothetical protein [Bacteroidota bacterium]